MTENEAIERLKCMRLFMQINDKSSESKFLEEDYIANEMAIKVIKEIQQYRAIGTVEECQGARERQIPRKLTKRQVGSNILMSKIYYCPTCNKKLYDCAIKNGKLDYVSPGSRKSKFCGDCGQALDWSDTP